MRESAFLAIGYTDNSDCDECALKVRKYFLRPSRLVYAASTARAITLQRQNSTALKDRA